MRELGTSSSDWINLDGWVGGCVGFDWVVKSAGFKTSLTLERNRESCLEELRGATFGRSSSAVAPESLDGPVSNPGCKMPWSGAIVIGAGVG